MNCLMMPTSDCGADFEANRLKRLNYRRQDVDRLLADSNPGQSSN